jgi:hypothetical protein
LLELLSVGLQPPSQQKPHQLLASLGLLHPHSQPQQELLLLLLLLKPLLKLLLKLLARPLLLQKQALHFLPSAGGELLWLLPPVLAECAAFLAPLEQLWMLLLLLPAVLAESLALLASLAQPWMLLLLQLECQLDPPAGPACQ